MNSLLLLFLMYAPYSDGILCGCITKLSVEKEYKKADVVFSGIVTESKPVEYRDTVAVLGKGENAVYEIFTDRRMMYKLKLSAAYKGKNLQDTLWIVTGSGYGDCGFQFEKGNNYLVYGNLKNKLADIEPVRDPFLYTNICYRTAIFNLAEEAALKQVLNKE